MKKVKWINEMVAPQDRKQKEEKKREEKPSVLVPRDSAVGWTKPEERRGRSPAGKYSPGEDELELLLKRLHIRYLFTPEEQFLRITFQIRSVKSSSRVELDLNLFKDERVYRSLNRIDFSNLRIFHLSNQMLRSIESLQTLYCPDLRQLNIYYNKISQFRSLAKCLHPALDTLRINQNEAKEVQKPELFFAMRLESVGIEGAGSNQVMMEDIGKAVKWRRGLFFDLVWKPNRRIIRTKATSMALVQ